MKMIFFSICIIGAASCNTQSNNTQALQNRIDTLEKRLSQTYKPGLGEFMESLQIHHAKLWFAGIHQNWQLADFETGEIKEVLENIPVYCANRPEIKQLPMIVPAIDSISKSISAKNAQQFTASFVLLTATCNGCHHASNHAFNVIKIPDTPPFNNQDFKLPVQ